jgi:hypothetical protein
LAELVDRALLYGSSSRRNDLDALFFGRCDTCAGLVATRYHSFNRQIERRRYPQAGDDTNEDVIVHVLLSDHLTQYCGGECAHVGAYCQLTDRGIPSDTTIEVGPIAHCSKCAKSMDLTQLHVAYELMDQTEIRQPWLMTIKGHDSTTVALVCASCEGDLIGEVGAQVMDGYEKSTTDLVESRRLEFLK